MHSGFAAATTVHRSSGICIRSLRPAPSVTRATPGARGPGPGLRGPSRVLNVLARGPSLPACRSALSRRSCAICPYGHPSQSRALAFTGPGLPEAQPTRRFSRMLRSHEQAATCQSLEVPSGTGHRSPPLQMLLRCPVLDDTAPAPGLEPQSPSPCAPSLSGHPPPPRPRPR